MKARVKATGELINLPRMTRVYSYKEDESMFFLKDLEILDNTQPDYWEKLLHQYAGMAMQGFISANRGFNVEEDMYNIPYFSELIATALVKKLKGE